MSALGSISNIYHTIIVSKYAVKGLEWIKDKVGEYVADYANTLSVDDINNSFEKMSANTEYDVEANREQVDNMSTQLGTFTENLSAYYEQNPDVEPNFGQFMANCNEAIKENPDVYSAYFLSKGVDPTAIETFNQKCAEGTVDFSDAKSIAMATFGSYATVSGISKEAQGGEQQTELAEEQSTYGKPVEEQSETQTDNAIPADTSVEVGDTNFVPADRTDKTNDAVYQTSYIPPSQYQSARVDDEDVAAKRFAQAAASLGSFVGIGAYQDSTSKDTQME